MYEGNASGSTSPTADYGPRTSNGDGNHRVHQQTEMLGGEIKRASELVSKFESVLGPIMAPPGPEPAEKDTRGGPESAVSPHTEHLRSLTTQLTNINGVMHGMLRRLEL
jgi:hypothetical protein